MFLIISGLSCLTALILYLWFFAIVYFVTSRLYTPTTEGPHSRFVFVVPAHNEESGITATVKSLLSVSYTRALFDVVVVADNCTDGTAEQARIAGAECIERFDKDLRGKGYALHMAFNKLIPRGYDAFIVIDADSIISENFLSVLDVRLSRGEQVIQGYYGMSNPDASILTYLFQVGNLIENKLYWIPKQAFGLPIILRGNGMCFAREIVEKFPWNAFSITEDTEYGMMLTDNGIRIHFADDIGVYACQPETLQQAFAQRVRWAAGNSTLTKGRAVKMMVSGLFQNNLATLDLGISLIAGSRPLLLMANILFLIISFIFSSQIVVCWAGSLLAAQVLYIGLGVALNGFTLQKMSRLFLSPCYLAWLCIISLLGAVGFRKNQWVRTTRS
jgi:cellulose synthase/poly-beta-1,6-N-acetylglucosamine synthase-like glycosyltransferase